MLHDEEMQALISINELEIEKLETVKKFEKRELEQYGRRYPEL